MLHISSEEHVFIHTHDKKCEEDREIQTNNNCILKNTTKINNKENNGGKNKMGDQKVRLSEEDVLVIKNRLSEFPMWVNEADVIARGLVARGIGDVEAASRKYEIEIANLKGEIAKRDAEISDMKELVKSYEVLLAEIRETTCRAIGIKIEEKSKK